MLYLALLASDRDREAQDYSKWSEGVINPFTCTTMQPTSGPARANREWRPSPSASNGSCRVWQTQYLEWRPPEGIFPIFAAACEANSLEFDYGVERAQFSVALGLPVTLLDSKKAL